MEDQSKVDSEAAALEWLRAATMRFARGGTTEQVHAMLEDVRVGWYIESFHALRQLVELVRPRADLTPGAVIFWMDATLALAASQPGAALVLAAGMRVAQSAGITEGLVQQLRTLVTPAADETRH